MELGEAGTCAAPEIDVDALDGAVLEVHDRATALEDVADGFRALLFPNETDRQAIDVKEQSPAGTYGMETEESATKVITKGWSETRPAKLVVTSQLGRWDRDGVAPGAAVDAHAFAVRALDYYRSAFGRESFDGKGGTVRIIAHDNSAWNDAGLNAKFNPLTGALHFGDGKFAKEDEEHRASRFFPLSGGFDVVVHELTHAVTHATSHLVYSGESGALNESFSDVMGASAEHWTELQPDAPDAIDRDMRMGERVTEDGWGIRNLRSPTDFGQPDRVVDKKKMCPDGRVHCTSAIPNKAFALMVLGGPHHDFTVPPMGWEAARDLWYRSMTNLRKPYARFVDVALEQVLTTVWTRPDALPSVACAWQAVGVLTMNELPLLVAVPCGAPPASVELGARPKDASGPCAGVDSGYVCDPNQAGTAFECKSGRVAGGADCADPTQRCKAAGPNDPRFGEAVTVKVIEQGGTIRGIGR